MLSEFSKEDSLTLITADLDHNMACIQNVIGISTDFVLRKLKVIQPDNPQEASLLYLDGMIDKNALQIVIASLLDRPPVFGIISDKGEAILDVLEAGVFGSVETKRILNIEEGIDQVLAGNAFLLFEGFTAGIVLSLPGWEDRGVPESKTQSVVKGPQDAFLETLSTNTSLVRRRIRDTSLRNQSYVIGMKTKTDVAIMYMEGTACEENVKHVNKKLEQMKLEEVIEGEYLEEILVGNHKFTLFPTTYNTDRPDTVAAGILEGKIAIFVDGSPFVMLVPALFVDFLQSAEDYYQPYVYSNLIRLLRYFCLFICMLAPSIYIALTTFHQDVLPTHLLLSLVAQREGIPFPAFIEALMMEIAFEILREAGIRMPRTIGQAVSIVGTIVIGQAAVEAGIVSAAMVIIVSITAVSSFVIPAYSMSIGIRIVRFLFMILAATFGIYGLTIGLIVLTIHLCSLQSLNKAYMSPLAPYQSKEQYDALFRFPYWLFRNKHQKADKSR